MCHCACMSVFMNSLVQIEVECVCVDVRPEEIKRGEKTHRATS